MKQESLSKQVGPPLVPPPCILECCLPNHWPGPRIISSTGPSPIEDAWSACVSIAGSHSMLPPSTTFKFQKTSMADKALRMASMSKVGGT
jgi:hypothetical protein